MLCILRLLLHSAYYVVAATATFLLRSFSEQHRDCCVHHVFHIAVTLQLILNCGRRLLIIVYGAMIYRRSSSNKHLGSRVLQVITCVIKSKVIFESEQRSYYF